MKKYFQFSKYQIEQLYIMSKLGMLGLLTLSILVASLLRNEVNHTLLIIGISMHIIVVLLRIYTMTLYQKMFQNHSNEWIYLFTLGTFLSGISWGAIILILNSIHVEYQYLVLSILVAITSAAITTLGSIFIVYLSFFIPIVLPVLLWLILQEGEIYFVSILLYLVSIPYFILTSYRVSENQKNIGIKNEEIQETQLEIIKRLGIAGEYRDNDTGEHVSRVSQNCQLLAKNLGYDEYFCQNILHASPLHDVGKIGISDLILLKPEKLKVEEFEKMKEHTIIGYKILRNHHSPIMKMASIIALTHHEKYDGSGYPKGLKANKIPIEGRIVAICDVYDALTSKRVYKKAWSQKEAIEYITKESGKHFDPLLVKEFLKIVSHPSS